MTKSELKNIIKECVEEILTEDLSDIDYEYAARNYDDKFTHRHNNNDYTMDHRPKITKNMSDRDKRELNHYDHGSRTASRHDSATTKREYNYHNWQNDMATRNLNDDIKDMDAGRNSIIQTRNKLRGEQ